ncbi:hypothetical protein [Actinomadura sp. 21ATH]|uniref:hypothetical protein n=1 Tax=Actinomadura sp. 21ATH TaxID=1735444 RepID=UPI0035C100D4
MTAPSPPPASPAAAPSGRTGVLDSALLRRGQERFTGTLLIEGGQNGTVTMRDGLVVAAGTPAAPGPESLLLRSGRISEADWTAAFDAAAPRGRLPAELVERGLLGDAGLQVLTQVAVVDAAFAMALCGVRTCTARPDTGPGGGTPGPVLPAEPGLDTGRLVREIARRLGAAVHWRDLGVEIHTRPHPAAEPGAPSADAPVEQGGPRGAVLAKVNGRRTARDIAFTLGRGLYPVMADLATLAEDGLIRYGTPRAAASLTLAGHLVPEPEEAPPPEAEPTPGGLPRRLRGTSGIHLVLPWNGDEAARP